MWSFENSKSDEASKIRWELVPFMHGDVLDLGCGLYKAFPHFTGVDSGKQWGKNKADVVVDTAEDLSRFASQSHDMVFSSHLLEHIENYKAALKEWWRVVKPGGYLCLYLPHRDWYPNVGGGRGEWREWYALHHNEFPTQDAAVEAYVAPRRAAGITDTGPLYAGTPYGNPDHKHDFYPDDIMEAMEELPSSWDLIECQERNETDEYSFFMVFKRLT